MVDRFLATLVFPQVLAFFDYAKFCSKNCFHSLFFIVSTASIVQNLPSSKERFQERSKSCRCLALRSCPPAKNVVRPVSALTCCAHSSASNDRRYRPHNTSGPGHSLANVSWGDATFCGGPLMKLWIANSTVCLEKFPTNPFS